MFLTAQEVLDNDHIVFNGEVRRPVRWRKSGASDANLAVCPGDFGFRLLPVGRPLLAFGHTSLIPGQVLRPFRCRCRGLAMRSPSDVTAKSVIPKSIPTASTISSKRTRELLSIARATYHRPSGSREIVNRRWVKSCRDRCRARTRRSSAERRSWPGTIHRCGNENPERVNFTALWRPRPALEPWIPGALGKERTERLVLVPERLLERNRRHARTRTPGPGPSSSRSAPGRSPRRRCPCARYASGRAGRPRSGSTPPAHSRTCGSPPPAAARPGTPCTGTPSSPSQDRTSDRKTAGATPYGRLSFPVPARGTPDSSPA